MDALAIINKYYPEDNELKHILLAHSRSVADKALWIAGKHPELNRQAVSKRRRCCTILVFL